MLYPSHRVYVAKAIGATLRSVRSGHIVSDDTDEFIGPARESGIGATP